MYITVVNEAVGADWLRKMCRGYAAVMEGKVMQKGTEWASSLYVFTPAA